MVEKSEGLTAKHQKANLTNEVHNREKRNFGLGLGGLGGLGGIGGLGSLGTGNLGAFGMGAGMGGLGGLGGGIGGLGALGGLGAGVGGVGMAGLPGHLQGATGLNAAGFGGLGRPTFDFADYYANFLADAAYDYYDWVCTGASCQLCDVLTGDCCDPNYDRNCFLPDSCANNPCLSGGTCISTLTVDFRPDFMCVCTAGLTGKYCQLIDEYSASVPVAAVGPAPIGPAPVAAAPVAPAVAPAVQQNTFQTVQTIAKPQQTATVQVVQTFPQNKNFQVQQTQQFQQAPQTSYTFMQPSVQSVQSQPIQSSYQTVQSQPIQTFQSAPQSYQTTYSTQTLSAAQPTGQQVFAQDGSYVGTLST